MADAVNIVGYKSCMFFDIAVNAANGVDKKHELKVVKKEFKTEADFKAWLTPLNASRALEHENSPIVFKGTPEDGEYVGGCDEWLQRIEEEYPMEGKQVVQHHEDGEVGGASFSIVDAGEERPAPEAAVVTIVGKKGDPFADMAFDASLDAQEQHSLQVEKILHDAPTFDKWLEKLNKDKGVGHEGSPVVFLGSPETGEYIGGRDDWLEYLGSHFRVARQQTIMSGPE